MRYQSYVFPAFITLLLITTFSYVDYAVTAIMLLLASIYSVRGILKTQKIVTYGLSAIMLGYLMWLCVIANVSPVPHASMANVVMLVGLPLMYLIVTQYQSLSEDWKLLYLILPCFGLVLSLWAVWQVANHIGYGHATGPFNDRNAFAASLNLLWFPTVFLFAASLRTSSTDRTAASYAFILFFMGMALFATTSRGGILTWAILLPILIWSIYQYTKSIKTIALILCLSALSYLASDYFLNNSIADRTFALTEDASTHARLQIWQSTVQMAINHPLIGTGWGTFAYYYPAHRLADEKSTAGFFAHNDYLQFAAEGGVIALLIITVVLFNILWQLKNNIFHCTRNKTESIALLLGVLALFIHAAVNFIFYFAFMSILAGLYLARVASLTQSPQMYSFPKFNGIRTSVKRLIALVLMVFFAIPYLIQIIAQLCLTGSNPGLRLIQLVDENATGFGVANVISSIYPSNGLAQEYIFRTYEHYLDKANQGIIDIEARRVLLKDAIQDFDEHRRRNANIASLGNREVRLILANDDISDFDAHAYQVLDSNLKADPYDGNSMMLLAKLQAKQGKHDLAMNTLQFAYNKVIKKRDQMLIKVEYLRQRMSAQYHPQLDQIEAKLQSIRIDAETGRADIELTNIYQLLEKELISIESALASQ